MNAHDSEKLAGILQGMGYTPAGDETTAGLVVYNTCCIRENAENRVFGNLGYMKYMKQKNPGLVVAVGGCMPQQEAALEKLKETGAADILFGTHNLHTFGSLLEQALDTGIKVTDIWQEWDGSDRGYISAVRENPWRSGVNIMYGCDNFCSYCVVPLVRGRERSRKPDEILDEIRALINDGVVEIMLLGQNVNSYGQKSNDGAAFPELLRLVAGLKPALPRIRFMTSHPKDLSLELIHAIRDCENICRHIHLPVQSGSDKILQAMNRKYTREDYLSLLSALRREVPDITVTTDIIVGFPGETDDDFEATLELVRQARFGGAFTFLYSKREGTKAAEMDCPVPENTANERFARLVDTINPIALEISKSWEGRIVQVLAEKLEKGMFTGRAGNNMPVHFPDNGASSPIGSIVPVKITEGRTFFLIGEQCYQNHE